MATGPGQAGALAGGLVLLMALAMVAAGSLVPHLAAPMQAVALAAVGVWIALRVLPGPATAPTPAVEVVPVSAVADLVTWHDAHGDVLRAGPAALDLLGATPASLAGAGLLERVIVADRPAFLKALSDAANGHGPVTVPLRLLGRTSEGDGRPDVLVAEMRALALLAPDAGGAAIIAFTRDVSAQRRHAQEADTARLEAEKANELKGRFLATVSHELRTPLNAIIGFSELLSAEHPFLVTEERRKEYAQIIRSSGMHLLEIVNTLLDMSKIESGNFHFEPESFDMRDLARSVCDLMQLKADEAGVTIERRLDADMPELLADRRACRQVLINLLSNAVKFTPPGGSVSIRLAVSADSVVLTVADTGIGIPESDLPRLGDPFFQSGNLHRRNKEGTGLGLSVVRGIVGLHHGDISVESGAGAGTTVSVALPLRPELGPARPKPVVLQTRPRVAARPLERKIA